MGRPTVLGQAKPEIALLSRAGSHIVLVYMSNSHQLSRNLIIFGVVLPLAAIVGYSLATYRQFSSEVVVGLVLAVLFIPVLLRWHHPLLILTWNGAINAFFIPGRPNVWMVIGGISFGITMLNCILNKEQKFQHVPAMTWSLLFLMVVVGLTAKISGGIGLRSLGGSQYGGRGYAYIIGGVIGYFALSSARISRERAQLFAVLFFLSALTYMVSNLAYMAGPSFWFLFYAFPIEFAMSQAVSDFMGESMTRLAGLGFASLAICNVLLVRYGVRGLFDPRRVWRPLVFVLAAALSCLGGFRSTLVIIVLLFMIQFCMEGLYRTRLVLVVLLAAVIGFALLIPLSSQMPLSVQRVLTVVPFLDVDSAAKANAEASLQWRLDMWRILLPDIERYFWIGKGFSINPTDLYLVEESIRRGFAHGYEGAVAAGDYHSGPLSLIIPFGVFGVIAFLCVLVAGGRVLYRNWKFGEADLRNINVFLFSMYLMKIIFYFVGAGAFYSDLPMFLGLIGFSIAVNGGVRVPAPEPQKSLEPVLQPAMA